VKLGDYTSEADPTILSFNASSFFCHSFSLATIFFYKFSSCYFHIFSLSTHSWTSFSLSSSGSPCRWATSFLFSVKRWDKDEHELEQFLQPQFLACWPGHEVGWLLWDQLWHDQVHIRVLDNALLFCPPPKKTPLKPFFQTRITKLPSYKPNPAYFHARKIKFPYPRQVPRPLVNWTLACDPRSWIENS